MKTKEQILNYLIKKYLYYRQQKKYKRAKNRVHAIKEHIEINY